MQLRGDAATFAAAHPPGAPCYLCAPGAPAGMLAGKVVHPLGTVRETGPAEGQQRFRPAVFGADHEMWLTVEAAAALAEYLADVVALHRHDAGTGDAGAETAEG